MNNFISEEIEKIYLVFKNNERLQKALDDNYLLLKRQSFIGEYTETAFKQKVAEIDAINKDKLYSLASICHLNKDVINSTNISILVDNSFLRKEIKDIYEGIDIKDETLKEIYFCFKYCSVSSFFQNNKKYFMPDYDLKKIEENEKLNVFMDALLKEFDKLNTTLANVKDVIDIDKIDGKYLSYLSQLLGYEKKDIPNLNEENFRELVKNIIEIYKIKGTNYSFELFFNFLGFNIEIQEFFFDRRYYFKIGGNNEFTNEKSKSSYNHYLTTVNPVLNNTDIFSRTETVTYSDLGTQYSLLEFDDLVKKYGPEAVLGYSKLDKNNQLYTDKIYTYFKTNYIYYNVTLPDRYPTAEELTAITSYLKFLSPVFIMRTIETQSAEQERDTMVIDMFDWQTSVDSNGDPINQTREYVIYNYTNSQLGQNKGKNLIFTRMFNYSKIFDGKKVSFLEVNPYPENPYNIQNEWYENNIDFSDITATKAFISANPEKFGKKIDYVITGTVEDYLAGDKNFVQVFDNIDTADVNALVPNKVLGCDFKKIYSQNYTNDLIDITDETLIFNNKEALDDALLTQDFRKKLFYGMKVAIDEGNSKYGIYRYQNDLSIISGAFLSPIAYTEGAPYNFAFETLDEAQTYSNDNKIPYGSKVFINDKQLIFTYKLINEKNNFITNKDYVFTSIGNARTYFNNHKEEILLNVEFYIKSEYRIYRFEHKNRNKNNLFWFSDENKLFKFTNGTFDDYFQEISLEGIILDIDGTSYIVDDPSYPSYNEKEDKENFIFYNNEHEKIRPNLYSSYESFDTDNIPFLIKYYASTYYASLSHREIGELKDLINSNSSYPIVNLPEVLTYIYTGDYDNDDNLLESIISELTDMRDSVIAYDVDGEIIVPAPDDMLTNYNKLIDFVNKFIGYDPENPEDKILFTAMFSDKEYVEKVLAWREKFFDDESLDRSIIEPDQDIILGDAKAFIGKGFGKINSPINSFTSDSYTSFDNSTCSYFKPKIPFYGMSNENGGKLCFYVLESDIIKYFDLNSLFKGNLTTFINAVFYENFQKNYPSHEFKEYMKIPFGTNSNSIYKKTVSGRKVIVIQTSKVFEGNLFVLSSKIEGHLLFNNFKKLIKNNRLVYPNGLDFIKKDYKNKPITYISCGYDKDFSIEVQNKSENYIEADINLDSNNNITLTTETTNFVKAGCDSDNLEIKYIPQLIELTFNCYNSEVNNNDTVFNLWGGLSSTYEQGDVLIDCGGSE